MIIRRELRPDSLISEGEITKLVKVLRKRNPREAQKALEYIWGVGQESVQRLVEQYQLVGAEPGEFADAVAEAAERRFPPATQRRGISVRPMDSSSGVLSRSSRIGGV